jgi:NitT/TauT family transport system substrate-binding protein
MRFSTRAAMMLSIAVLCRVCEAQTLEQPNVKVMLDWVVQGTHAPFFVAEKKGYFAAEGFRSVAIDRGAGAGATINAVASGAYEFGLSDLPVMVKFDAQNPASPLTAVYVLFDETPLCLVSLASRNAIRGAADLDNKRVAAPAGAAIVNTMPILLKAVGRPETKVNWVTAAPDVMGNLLMRGDADAIGGFTNSMIMAVKALGVRREDMAVFKYADAGVDLYGLSLMVPRRFAQANPRTVAAMVRAFNRGLVDVIADPATAIRIMADRDPLMNASVEAERLQIALAQVVTRDTRANGLGAVTRERLGRTIDNVIESEGLKGRPQPDVVFDPAFLPAASERRVPGAGN